MPHRGSSEEGRKQGGKELDRGVEHKKHIEVQITPKASTVEMRSANHLSTVTKLLFILPFQGSKPSQSWTPVKLLSHLLF